MSLTPALEEKITAAATQLQSIARDFTPAAFANSFGAEDMVLMDLISQYAPEVEVFSLDTGRLPEETYQLMQTVQQHYTLPVITYFPTAEEVEGYVRNHGPNAFYDSVELRKQCCFIRKVLPLRRALAGKQAWITGLRREQAPTRKDLGVQEWDTSHAMHKFNPLMDWSHADIWAYLRHYKVPYNALHDKFYPSIGCAPCTRAISVGEDVRAGRWWWENPENKECGLHSRKQAP